MTQHNVASNMHSKIIHINNIYFFMSAFFIRDSLPVINLFYCQSDDGIVNELVPSSCSDLSVEDSRKCAGVYSLCFLIQTDKRGNPMCCHMLRAIPGNKPVEVSLADVHHTTFPYSCQCVLLKYLRLIYASELLILHYK